MYSSRSDTKPAVTDTTSSSRYNYYRTEITESEVADEDGGTRTEYTYKEEKVPKEQWATYIAQKETEQALQELILSQMEV